jgi:hypothetical protein
MISTKFGNDTILLKMTSTSQFLIFPFLVEKIEAHKITNMSIIITITIIIIIIIIIIIMSVYTELQKKAILGTCHIVRKFMFQ